MFVWLTYSLFFFDGFSRISRGIIGKSWNCFLSRNRIDIFRENFAVDRLRQMVEECCSHTSVFEFEGFASQEKLCLSHMTVPSRSRQRWPWKFLDECIELPEKRTISDRVECIVVTGARTKSNQRHLTSYMRNSLFINLWIANIELQLALFIGVGEAPNYKYVTIR